MHLYFGIKDDTPHTMKLYLEAVRLEPAVRERADITEGLSKKEHSLRVWGENKFTNVSALCSD